MDTLEAISKRRSVKHYNADQGISEEDVKKLLTAAALAPTSFNMQNRHFVVVTDAEIKAKLCAAAWNQEQVKDAALVVVLTADLQAHTRTERYLRNAPAGVQEKLTPMIMGFYDGKTELLRDEACRSVGMASMNIMLAAKAMGYDSCPMIGYDPQAVSQILELDEDHPPLLMVVVGAAKEAARDRLGLLDFEELVSINTLGKHDLTGPVTAD